jgi:phospholipase/carboxylesterase
MLDGPRLPPASSGKPKSLVVFLHGYGADGNDLIGIGREWARQLPHTAFASPNAGQPCTGAPMGRQWFPLTMRDPDEFAGGLPRPSRGSTSFSTPSCNGTALKTALWRWSASARER